MAGTLSRLRVRSLLLRTAQELRGQGSGTGEPLSRAIDPSVGYRALQQEEQVLGELIGMGDARVVGDEFFESFTDQSLVATDDLVGGVGLR